MAMLNNQRVSHLKSLPEDTYPRPYCQPLGDRQRSMCTSRHSCIPATAHHWKSSHWGPTMTDGIAIAATKMLTCGCFIIGFITWKWNVKFANVIWAAHNAGSGVTGAWRVRAVCYVISNGIVWYCILISIIYNKNGEQSPQLHQSPLVHRGPVPRGPLFTSRTVQTTWVVLGAVLPTSLATAGPWMPSLGKKTMPRCPVWCGSAPKMKECQVNRCQYRF